VAAEARHRGVDYMPGRQNPAVKRLDSSTRAIRSCHQDQPGSGTHVVSHYQSGHPSPACACLRFRHYTTCFVVINFTLMVLCVNGWVTVSSHLLEG
jgi:hypothetical protein